MLYCKAMSRYAVVETGGKQYRVTQGDVLAVERLETPEGGRVEFDRVLLVQEADHLQVGTPLITGAKVIGEIVDHGRDRKVLVFKKKRKSYQKRVIGHRQPFTQVKITEIALDTHGH